MKTAQPRTFPYLTTYTQVVVMLAVAVLGDYSYGCNVASIIGRVTYTQRRNLYGCLAGLVKRGYLQDWTDDRLSERFKFYSITDKGQRILADTLQHITDLHAATIEVMEFVGVTKKNVA